MCPRTVRRGLFFLSFLTVAVPRARAGDEVFDARGLNRNRELFSQLPYEHIDPLTGGLVLTFTDLLLPGNAGFDLAIQRSYNSKFFRNYQTTGETPDEDTWAGLGWSFHLGRVANPNGATPGPVEMPDGSQHKLYPHVDGSGRFITRDFWEYEIGTTPLLRLPDGRVYRFGKQVTLPGGQAYRYATRIEDPFASTIDIAYMTTPQDGISTITQGLGAGQQRTISFAADAANRSIQSMTYNSGSRTYTWQYTHQGTAHTGHTILTAVQPPEGPSWQYTYNTTSQPRYEMTRFKTPHGGEVSFTYQDRTFYLGSTVPVTTRAVITRTTQAVRDVPSGTWTYAYAQGSSKNQTLVTAPCSTTTYTFLGVGTYTTTGAVWKIGLMSGRVVADGSGTLESETLGWTTSPNISNATEIVGNNQDVGIKVPLLQTRTATRGPSTFTTTNSYSGSNYADYGRPNQTADSQNGGSTRTTTRVFQYGFTPYIVDRTQSETVAVGSDAFVRSFTWNSSTGFKSSESIYGITTTFIPTATGNVDRRTDANGHATTYTYSWGVLRNVQTPEFLISRVINPEGTVASETRRGFTTSFLYDGLFRRTRVTPPVGNAVVTSYDNSGGASVAVTRGPNGSGGTSSVTTSLDGLGRVTGTSNSIGVRTRLSYDACGRQDYASHPYTTSDVGTSFDFDGLGRLTRKTNANNTFVSYAHDGIDVTVTDEEGRVSVQDRSAFGDPDETRLAAVTAAKNTGIQQTTSYTYNALGSLKLVTLPGGKTRSFTYNTKNQLTSEKHPEIEGSVSVSYTYDNAGNLKTRTDPQGTTTFNYDGNDRLTSVDRPGIEHDTTSIQFDDSDNRTFVSSGMAGSSLSPLITSSFTFDGANRLTARTDVVNGKSFATTYGYDGNDNMTDLNYPSGPQVDYAFDSENRITVVTGGATTYASSFQYHPSGAPLSFRPGGSNFTQQFSYHPLTYRLTGIDTGTLDLGYGYDDVGNVTSISDPRPGMSQSFGYDKLDRLEQVLSGPGSGSFVYNALGDRTSKTSGGSVSYSYDATTLRLQSAGGQSYLHDPSGNMTADGLGSYTYTPDNMMDRATTAGGTTTYWYDADMLRKAKLGADGDRFFVHGPGNQLLVEFEPDCTGTPRPTRSYVYAGSRLIASIRPTDQTPSVGFVTTSSSTSEAGGSVSIVVRLTTPSGAATTCPVTVSYATSNGTATAGSDYTAQSGTLTFPTGSASVATQSVAIPILDDSVDELAETLTLSLSSPHGAILTQSTHSVIIVDNDPPALFVNDVNAYEGNAGTQAFSFTISLSTPAEAPVTVNYATSDGTANAGTDYTSVSASVTFAIGEAAKNVTVQVNGDTTYEEDETFTLSLSGASGATIGDGQGLGTIRNEDGEVTVSATLVPPGGTVSATVRGGISALDWVGVFKVNAPDNDPGVARVYVPSPRPTTMALTVPTGLGFYNVRLFANDTLAKLSTSQTFQVGTGPTLFADDLAVAEGNAGTTSADFVVTLSPAASQTVTVNYATSDGSANSGTDFAWSAGALTFLAGETSKTLTVVVNGDTTPEGNETFFVNLANATGGAVVGNKLVQGTITNDDGSLPLTCPASVALGATFNVTVNAGSSSTDWVALYPDGAANNAYLSWVYVPLPRPQTVSLTAPTTAGSYDIRLWANNSTASLLGACDIRVGLVPALSINDVSVTEGNAGSANATFTVSLSPTASGTITVEYATADGTATAGSDYVWATGTLSFAPGETSKTLTVQVTGDTAFEPSETFFVNLGGPTGGAVIGDGQGVGTIADNDGLTCPATVTAGASLNVTASAGSSSTDWVALYPDGAANNAYLSWVYVSLPRPQVVSLTAPAAAGSYDLRLWANNSTANLLGACDIQVVPTLTINDVSVMEGNAGSVSATFTVTLSPAASGTVTVDYATANNTALAGSDYTSLSGALTFNAGETTKMVTVLVTGDIAFESSETFYVNLSGATGGAAIGDAQGLGTIVDNDGLTCPATVNPGVSFNVTVSAGSSSTDWVALYPDGAANNAYLSWVYVPLPRPQVVSLTAPTTAGSYDIRLWANNSTANLLGACDIQVAVVPTLAINDVSVTEGNAGSVSASFTVTLSPAASGTVTVDYATANYTALAGSDYTSASGTLTFSAGETTKTVTVQVTGDTALESTETFYVNLSGATGGAAIGDAQGVGTIVDNDGLTCPASVTAGASFNVTVSAGSSSTDWVALYPNGAANNAYLSWVYVPLPRPQTVSLTAPATAGSYDIRLWANNSTAILLGACDIQVP